MVVGVLLATAWYASFLHRTDRMPHLLTFGGEEGKQVDQFDDPAAAKLREDEYCNAIVERGTDRVPPKVLMVQVAVARFEFQLATYLETTAKDLYRKHTVIQRFWKRQLERRQQQERRQKEQQKEQQTSKEGTQPERKRTRHVPPPPPPVEEGETKPLPPQRLPFGHRFRVFLENRRKEAGDSSAFYKNVVG